MSRRGPRIFEVCMIALGAVMVTEGVISSAGATIASNRAFLAGGIALLVLTLVLVIDDPR